MNLFLPICRDLFINFEWFLFNWKLLQSPGSECGFIWTWVALDPNKEENKKRRARWLPEGMHSWYCAPASSFSQTPSPGSSFLPPFVGKVLLGTCWWKGSPVTAPGVDWLPRWSLCSLLCPQDWGLWCAGGLWRVLHPCATVRLWQNAKHVGALKNIFKWSWSAAFNVLREQGLVFTVEKATGWPELAQKV